MRDRCLLCATKEKTGKQKGQCCAKRSSVYEIWCLQCQARDIKKLEEKYEGDELDKEKEKILLYKYIGETNRSVYERSWEHLNGLKSIDKDSFMLKHAVDQHAGDELNTARYGIKVVRYTKSSFERQILESVCLQDNRDHNILKSKSEYNR